MRDAPFCRLNLGWFGEASVQRQPPKVRVSGLLAITILAALLAFAWFVGGLTLVAILAGRAVMDGSPASTITYHPDLIQGTDEWLAARRGLLTASEMKLALTPTLKPANNEKTRAHVYELLAQRISGYVEPTFVGDDMLRGMDDELAARAVYHEWCAPVADMGFITNNRWGFTLGYSPDGLVGDDGAIEVKGRRQKFQVQTIAEHIGIDRGTTIPADFLLQVQTGLLVSERSWIDFISYSGGLPMVVIRVHPQAEVQQAILDGAAAFEAQLAARHDDYRAAMTVGARLFPTERRVITEMF